MLKSLYVSSLYVKIIYIYNYIYFVYIWNCTNRTKWQVGINDDKGGLLGTLGTNSGLGSIKQIYRQWVSGSMWGRPWFKNGSGKLREYSKQLDL